MADDNDFYLVVFFLKKINRFVSRVFAQFGRIETGRLGAGMNIPFINDNPVNFMLD